MKLLKSILGLPSNEPPKWDIKPQSERPAANQRKEPVLAAAAAAKLEDDNPFMDAELDTIQLEVDVIGDDDPYQTHTWEMDRENETRSLKTMPVGAATKKKARDDFNPYDTGSNRRGWKS